MKLEKQLFENAKHILLITDNESFANASALYAYILTLHKKVSIQQSEPIEMHFSFLRAYNKLRDKTPSSADYHLEVSTDTKLVYDFFKAEGNKLNKNMASSLYSGLLIRYDSFMAEDCDATIFAMASELIQQGAEYKLAQKQILQSLPLSFIRLKAILLKSLLLCDNASCAELFVSQTDLSASGSTLNEAYKIMKEVMNIAHVSKVVLYKSDENKRILKTIQGKKFEK